MQRSLLFLQFRDYYEAVQSCSDRPTGHKRELFSQRIPFEDFYVPRFDDLFFPDDIGEFFLIVIHDDLIPKRKFVDEGKNTIVFAFNPWIIGAMTKNECISLLSGFGSPRISHHSLFEFVHENILYVVKIESGVELHIHEGDIFPDFWYNNDIIVWSYIKTYIKFCLS